MTQMAPSSHAKIINLGKELRKKLHYFDILGDFILLAFQLLKGVLLLPISARIEADTSLKQDTEALIICPAPALNPGIINLCDRHRYTVSFLNSACESAAYSILKPDRYFLIDPAYFTDNYVVHDQPWALETINRVISTIKDETYWPMTVYVPWHYTKSNNARQLQENQHITVVGISTFVQSNCKNSYLKMWGFGRKLLSPVYQNVLCAAIFTNIMHNHRRILLWGAHHTWLKDNWVNNSNQLLQTIRRNDNELHNRPVLNKDGSRRLLHDYLRQLALVFEQYHALEAFSKTRNQTIINVTDDSFIDAFDRMSEIELVSAGLR